jgi:hypothetical protein
MVRRCFPVAKIVGSSPTGVVFAARVIFFAFLTYCGTDGGGAVVMLVDL